MTTVEKKSRPLAIPNLKGVPQLPKDAEGEGPVFNSPWEAKAFSIVVLMYQRGHFTWKEWVDHLSEEIARAKAEGRPDHGAAYYELWLTAAEKLLATKGLLNAEELLQRKEELTVPAIP